MAIYNLFLLLAAFFMLDYFGAGLQADSFNIIDSAKNLSCADRLATGDFSKFNITSFNIAPNILTASNESTNQNNTDGDQQILLNASGDLDSDLDSKLNSDLDSNFELGLDLDLESGSNLLNSDQIYRGQHEGRKGVFQKLNCSFLLMPDGGNDGLGLTQTDISLVFALPCPSVRTPLIITPSFSYKHFEGKNSSSFDLYNTGVDFRWLLPAIERKLSFDVAVSILYGGNFEGSTGKALRYPAHVAGLWIYNSQWKFIFGVAYLDRNDEFNCLPIGGFIWTPNPDFSIELLFPVTKISRRLTSFDQLDAASKRNYTRWVYTGIEFAGSSWYYAQNGIGANLDYSDLRIMIGYEHRQTNAATLNIETGVATIRKLELQGFPKHEPDMAFFIKFKLAY
ncbi:MAG: hypothetical protein LBP59_07795 [Planctomycetaceae bacterium]|nr:hypothetical protein [Planctomycetaceae bacterium]